MDCLEDKISIIVPVYNVEDYLRECIDSIRNQTYHNLEIILIDDESPDQCGIICDKYAQIDSRIKVIHQNNTGVSGARNAGLDIATGKYVAFVDSDDMVHPQYIEFMHRAIRDSGSDIAYCGIASENITPPPGLTADKNFAEQEVKAFANPLSLYFDEWILPNVFNKLISKTLIDETRFRAYKRAEDLLFCIEILKKAKCAAGLKRCNLYYYRQRVGSCMGDTSADSLVDLDARLEAYALLDGDDLAITRRKMAAQTFRFFKDFALTSRSADKHYKEKLRQSGHTLIKNMWGKEKTASKLELGILHVSPQLWITICLIEHKLFKKPLYLN
jgi:glycosyltransferase involved in cell wall biosynthesis